MEVSRCKYSKYSQHLILEEILKSNHLTGIKETEQRLLTTLISREIPEHASREKTDMPKHIKSKRKQLRLRAKQMNLLLQHKAVLRPIWTYGIQLWKTVSSSNIEIPQRFQSKTFRSILNAPWYINNHRIHEDLQTNTVLSEIKKLNIKYLNKLENHSTALAVNLLDNSETTHRLKRNTVLTLRDRPE
jgi:hypothetical protein